MIEKGQNAVCIAAFMIYTLSQVPGAYAQESEHLAQQEASKLIPDATESHDSGSSDQTPPAPAQQNEAEKTTEQIENSAKTEPVATETKAPASSGKLDEKSIEPWMEEMLNPPSEEEPESAVIPEQKEESAITQIGQTGLDIVDTVGETSIEIAKEAGKKGLEIIEKTKKIIDEQHS